MKRMNLVPAYRYRFGGAMKGAAVFFGIMILMTALVFCSLLYATWKGAEGTINFAAFGFAAMITMFVTGICTIREDLRLMLQNGVGRRTVFTAELLVILSVSLLLGLAGELLVAVSQIATSHWQNFYIWDIFQLLFFNEMGKDLTFAAHIQSMLCSFGLYTCANLTGIFVSLLFYRLNKVWTIIVAVGTPIFFFIGLPLLMAWHVIPRCFVDAVGSLVSFSLHSSWNMLLVFVVTAALTAIMNWLLLHRAPVKPIK